MAKFPKRQKTSKVYTQEMIVDLCTAIADTKNATEAAELLTDLLGKQEMEMLARRLRIAGLLLENYTYEDISGELKVSPTTVSRVVTWLNTSGDGYRNILERIKKKRSVRQENEKPFTMKGIKRKHSMYYWPQLMLEYWVKNSTLKQKEAMIKILSKVDEKSKQYKNLMNLLIQNK